MIPFGSAIVGCGSIASVHTAALAQNSSCRLVAVTDINGSKARALSDAFSCEFIQDYHELLAREDIHVVHICTPHHLHAPMVKEALLSGKHVLVEKPVALSIADAEEMQAIASRMGKQLGVVFQNRYNESSQIIKNAIESGHYGRLLGMRAILTWHRDEAYYRSGDWRGKWATEGGGVLINQAIHTLDLLQWFGGEIISLKGSYGNYSLEGAIEVEDTAHAIIHFNNGARAVFFATNAYVTDNAVDFEAMCEHGTFIQRRESLYLQQDGQETLISEPPLQDRLGKSYWGIGHVRCIHDFYRSLEENIPFSIDAKEGAKALSMVLSLYGKH